MRKVLLCFVACLMVLYVILPKAWAATNEENEQFSYEIMDGKAIIYGRSSDLSGDVVIPGNILGYPVVVGSFSHCDTIKSVTISNGAVGIDEYAFGASSITEIRIPKSVTTIGEGAFLLCSNLKSAVLSEGITSISDRMFSSCENLVEVNIPDKVTYIGERAFSGCIELSNITIPNGVITIGHGAFANCDTLTSIVIPESVTTIGDIAFVSCDKLERIWVDPSNNAYSSDQYDVLYNKSKTRLITVPAGLKGEFAIPESVTMIEASAFASCAGVTNVVLSDKITVVEDGTFYGCSSLTKMVIPENVTTIGAGAFEECTNLEEIYIPKSVQTIGADAFLLSGLKTIYYEGTESEWKNVDIEDSMYATEPGDEKLSNVKIVYNYTEEENAVTEVPPKGNYIWLGAILISAVVAGVLTIVLVAKRKK